MIPTDPPATLLCLLSVWLKYSSNRKLQHCTLSFVFTTVKWNLRYYPVHYLLDIWYFRLSFGTWRICILRWWAGWSWGMIVINTRFYQKINQHIKSREIAGIVTRSSHVIITKIMTTSQSKEIILSIVHLHNCCLTQVTLLSNNQLQRRQYCTTFSRKEHFFGMPYGELTLLVSVC